jgi:SAM-dependent methyltransferase
VSNDREKIEKYFDRTSVELDSFYDRRGTIFQKFLSKLFRAGMYERYILTLDICSKVDPGTVLDIGCGSGRYLIALAKMGWSATGVDVSQAMLQIAEQNAERENLSRKITLKRVDFDTVEFSERFDVTLAMGYFDYQKEPLGSLRKMVGLAKNFSLASFPARYSLQMPLRRVYLQTRHAPVYFYARSTLENLCSKLGLREYEIIDIPDGFLLKAYGVSN